MWENLLLVSSWNNIQNHNWFGWELEDKSQLKKLHVLFTVMINTKSEFKKLNEISSVAYKQKFRNISHKFKP